MQLNRRFHPSIHFQSITVSWHRPLVRYLNFSSWNIKWNIFRSFVKPWLCDFFPYIYINGTERLHFLWRVQISHSIVLIGTFMWIAERLLFWLSWVCRQKIARNRSDGLGVNELYFSTTCNSGLNANRRKYYYILHMKD